MYSLEDLKEIVNKNQIPNEDKISLFLYCQYFETFIEHKNYVITRDITVSVDVKNVAHLMNLHKFYDPQLRNNRLRFAGAFSGVDGYANMKRKIITIDTLRKSKKCKVWESDSTRKRLLLFPYVAEALLKGQWYIFDQEKYDGTTEVAIDFIVFYTVGNYKLNICVTKDKHGKYYCISNFVVYKSNKYILNQEKLFVERIIEIDTTLDKETRVVCHRDTINNMLDVKRNTQCSIVDEGRHKKALQKSINFHSKAISNGLYEITYLKLDTTLERIINK